MAVTDEIVRPDHLKLVMMRPGVEFEVRSLMAKPLGLETHYFDFSVLCAGRECPGCKHRGKRWLGYLAVETSQGPRLLELTAAAWQSAYGRLKFEKYESAAGVVFRVRKPALRSPVMLEPLRLDGVCDKSAAAVRVLRTVARLYKLPLPLPKELAADWDVRVSDAMRAIVAAAVRSAAVPAAR